MKSRMILAALLIMQVITGVASALTLDLTNDPCGASVDNPMKLAPGESIILSLKGTQIATAGETFPVEVASKTSDLTVTILKPVFGPVSKPTFCQAGTVQVTLATNPVNEFNSFSIQAGPGSVNGEIQTASRIVSVPEFATVAMPVAAIMGLMFLVYRKKKEE